MLRSLRHYQGHITLSIACRKEVWEEETLDDIPRKDERGSSSIRRTQELFQSDAGETSERRGGAHMDLSERLDTI